MTMKKNLSFTAALAALVLTGSALAFTPDPAKQPIAGTVAKLVPSKVVKPTNLPLSFTRAVVNVEFSLDASGRPQDIKIISNADRSAKEQIAKAFQQWKFEPIAREPGAEPKRFVLPLDVIPEV